MIPSANSQNGKVLRLLIDGQSRSAVQVCDGIGAHPATAITARIRDLRKIGIEISCTTEPRPGQKKAFVYRITGCPGYIREALEQEKFAKQQAAA